MSSSCQRNTQPVPKRQGSFSDHGISNSFSVATFNVRGLSSCIKKELLASDLERYGVHVCCLQETKVEHGFDDTFNNYRVFGLPCSSRHHGIGFAVHRCLFARLHKFWKICDRVAVLQIHLSPSNILSIINVYAPTSTVVAQDHDCLSAFYSSLKEALSQVNSTSFVMIAGDFNAKLGVRDLPFSCLGRHSRGRRNYSGKVLAEFCDSNSLFACNTAFKHPARHQTTWTGWRHNSNGGPPIPVYNQIDFVLCKQRQKALFTDARSYGGVIVDTDHRLVVARARLSRCYGLWGLVNKPHSASTSSRINTEKLSDPVNRQQYRDKLEQRMEADVNETQSLPTADHLWTNLSAAVLESATSTVGIKKKTKKNHRFIDPQLEEWSNKKAELRRLIESTDDIQRVQQIRHERNVLSHKIRNRVKQISASILDDRVAEIGRQKNNAKMYKAVHLLQRKRQQPLTVHNSNKETVLQPSQVAVEITHYFSDMFADSASGSGESITPTTRPLSKPISQMGDHLQLWNRNQ